MGLGLISHDLRRAGLGFSDRHVVYSIGAFSAFGERENPKLARNRVSP